MTVDICQGDALAVLRTMPSDHFHCVVTSPPYWGLRDYGTGAWEGGDQACDHSSVRRGHGDEKQATSKGTSRDPIRPDCRYCGARRIDQQIGLEPTPEEWCARLVEVFREVRRVLRPDSVLWLNIGDSYATGGYAPRMSGRVFSDGRSTWGAREQGGAATAGIGGLKPKDLVGQPWLLAFALRADGWLLRSEIIWSKPNPMPESVRDRPTKAHEQVFLLTKSGETTFWVHRDLPGTRTRPAPDYRWVHKTTGKEVAEDPGDPENWKRINLWSGRDYFYDAEAVREPHSWLVFNNPVGRNLRSVWTIATDPLPSIEVDGEKLDHFASYPVELARRCILAGTSAKGCCPECGAPWARVVETEQVILSANGGPAGSGNSHEGMARYTSGPRTGRQDTTTGWRPTCSCPESLMRMNMLCRVLDPFGGSGRTALAAEELQRDCTLIELNPKSVAMAEAQIERAKARRMIGDTERVPVHEGQMRLPL